MKIFSFKNSKVTTLFISFLVVILVGAFFLIGRQYTKSNTDYICMKVADTCTRDDTQVQDNFSCINSLYQRNLKGIRTISTTTFEWRRTYCPEGYVQIKDGTKSGGASGLITNKDGATTERVIVEYQACSILEYGTSCGGGGTSCTPTVGQYRNGAGQCVPIPPVVIDLCTNINDGLTHDQSYITSKSLVHDPIENRCSPKDAVIDLCKQDGIQSSLPWLGYTWADSDGWCHTPVTAVINKKILLDVNCSANNGATWNDCSRVVLPSRSQPIKLMGIIDSTPNKPGTYEWSDLLATGQPVAYFDSINPSETSNLVQPFMNLNLNTDRTFKKDIELKFYGPTGGYNTIKKTINIIIASQDTIIEK